MKKFLFILSFLFMQAAHADELIDAQTCRYLASYKQPPGVEYQPGTDVHGKAVVEADISPPVIVMPETYSFDVTVDVAQKIGLPVPPGQNLVKIGTITNNKGQLLFNGQPLEGPAEANLVALCADQPEKPAK